MGRGGGVQYEQDGQSYRVSCWGMNRSPAHLNFVACTVVIYKSQLLPWLFSGKKKLSSCVFFRLVNGL